MRAGGPSALPRPGRRPSARLAPLHPARRLQPEGTHMVDIAAGGRLPTLPSAKMSGRRRAAGIYGAIVTAAILDVAGGKLPTDTLVVAAAREPSCYGTLVPEARNLRSRPVIRMILTSGGLGEASRNGQPFCSA